MVRLEGIAAVRQSRCLLMEALQLLGQSGIMELETSPGMCGFFSGVGQDGSKEEMTLMVRLHGIGAVRNSHCRLMEIL